MDMKDAIVGEGPPSCLPLPLSLPLSSLSTIPSSPELNNNNKTTITSSSFSLSSSNITDIVSLLQLKDSSQLDDQLSHASSLESLLPRQGSHSPNQSHHSSQQSISASTSCSDSSFEMASTTSSISQDDIDTTTRHGISSSISLQSFPTSSSTRQPSLPIRDSIQKEINSLDTSLPSFDFDQLEKKLTTNVTNSQEEARKRLGEEVRRQLAQTVEYCHPSTSSSSSLFSINTKRQLRSNLGKRLQTASTQLQVCYMNELSEGSDSDDDDDDTYLPLSSIRSSKSVPDFKETAARARHLRRCAIQGRRLTPDEREDVLRAETLAVQAAATTQGRKTIEELRIVMKKRYENTKRYSRHILSKMNNQSLQEIHEAFEDRIEATNAQLVSLLMARDSLHMERDSILVDIGDIVEGHRSSQIDIPTLLRLQDTNPKVPNDVSTPT